ncbi:MAG TPA: YlbF family regulator [Candidatus Fimicola cottocaccae]|mgnify:CR=1 FL=1|nr:YlbF family regulator [Candidatus Fimicola cottocaccae]
MTRVYDLARELGNELLKTKEVEKLMEAKKAFDADEEAVKLLAEYTEIQQEMQMKMASGHLSMEEEEETKKLLTEKSQLIQKNESAINLFNAENEYNTFINSVFSIIQSTMSGEDQCSGGCDSGCCSGCSGCH